ncbi:multidrug efflux transporter AcrB transmembrane domain-containing protein [Schizophyllum commune H4-8]|uniref:SSD domain-containing protein n=1 Tax=Schizophyllum commune (strain H4-8 / FGSC 9210) TaxID=578458 RepID=D8PKB4_SCHCM|nr:multidrug efflux transporter AcrB transmembrane domain-containing protein [Schizophyllum commune H4-8]KAI5894088.1 multidrug efflux transporter AcrB transmembrane domain-containing protein [Schizophyllum commune H4-8]
MDTIGEPGRCAMRSSCGRKGFFGKELPCPYDGPAVEPEDAETRKLLADVCGAEFAEGPTCCTSGQLETLRDNFATVDNIISSCPACRNNFHSFFCSFTCSPDQATFVNITETQKSQTGETAVKSLDFFVEEQYAKGFFDSCKSVQVGATNGYAMDLIGGGAKDYKAFLKFLGDEKDIGSPFQINFPHDTPSEFTAYNATPRNCADNDLASRCTCIDCPDICPTRPPIDPPGGGPTCHVGAISCLTFVLTLTYGLAVVGFLFGYLIEITIRKRRERLYERVALSVDNASISPRSNTRGLVGAGSLAHYVDEPARSASEHDLGPRVALLDPVETVQPRQFPLQNFLRRMFYRLGLFAAGYPWATFALVFTAIGLLNIGWKRFEVETDPVRLWVAPTSESKQQKEFFDEHFGPFYRAQQIFVTAEEDEPAMTFDRLEYWFDVEREIRELKSSPHNYTLDDVCFKPAGSEGACVFQSVGAWFDTSLEGYDEDTWAEHVQQCALSPVECLPDFQQPLSPEFVLGGVPQGENDTTPRYTDAAAMVVNIVVSDSLDEIVQAKAMEWETALKDYLHQVAEEAPEHAGLQISFSTGVSLEEELNKSTNTDVKIVVLSYLAMFFYVALTLGSGSATRDEETIGSSLRRWARNFPGLFKRRGIMSSSISTDSREVPTLFPRLPRKLFVGSKVTLGLFGIILVILSVSSSVGLFSAMGVKVTLIIAEVIPFLVLAVGVDNVFILVHELDRQNLLHGPNAAALIASQHEHERDATSPISSHRSPFDSTHDDVDAASMPLLLSAEERVARALAKMGPSILLSATTETIAFALGAIVPMPAVRNFALYAAGSVFLNAVLQVTVFVSALLLDLKRVESNRVDCFPCVRLPPRIALSDGPPGGAGLGVLARFIRRYYAPFLLKPVVKGIVFAIFMGMMVLSAISMQHLRLGLDQRLALPSDSYLVDYFNDMDQYLDIGPPVYFVVDHLNATDRAGQQELCGRFTTCSDASVANVLEAERKRPDVSFISQPTASWIDDFLQWLDPAKETCCRVRKRDPSVFCTGRESSRVCQPCLAGQEPPWNITMDGLPEDGEFMRYLNQWLISPTTEECPLAGAASFGTALSLSPDSDDVVASHFRTAHRPLKTQEDFIHAFAAAHRIADDLSAETGARVFPYSLFYVFFDQYAHIAAITQEVLGFGLAAVLAVTAVLLGSWRTGVIVTAVVGLTVVNVMGVMAVWGIMLNAVSLVNLVISLGIAVEFCAHVARAFMSAGSGLPMDHPAGQKERDERMWNALVDVGPSVLSGITFTKLIGMCVLALTRSKLLEIYYFRMWLTLIISGALHGLVLLPVILSVAGGPGFPQQEADEEWMANAIRNDYEYAPFLADDDSYHSD